MSLIKCPECNKEISDKSEKCIHCGYPLKNTSYVCEEICGKNVDVSFLLDHSVSQAKQMKELIEITGCSLLDAKKIVLKYHPTSIDSDNNIIKCPKCGCTNIQVVRRNWSFLRGFATNKTDRVCTKCNYKW